MDKFQETLKKLKEKLNTGIFTEDQYLKIFLPILFAILVVGFIGVGVILKLVVISVIIAGFYFIQDLFIKR